MKLGRCDAVMLLCQPLDGVKKQRDNHEEIEKRINGSEKWTASHRRTTHPVGLFQCLSRNLQPLERSPILSGACTKLTTGRCEKSMDSKNEDVM